MIYKFKDFQFCCNDNILTKQGKIILLNEKPALILRLLLTENEKIHSKSNILDAVWPDRVVTEQVIFQNISYLRARIGDDAIKTFSKKGYQWHLPLSEVDTEQTPKSDRKQNTGVTTKTEQTKEKPSHVQRKLTLPVSIVITLIIAMVIILVVSLPTYNHSENTDSNQIKVITMTGNNQIDFSSLSDISAQQLFDSPFSVWQKNTTSDSQLLLATQFYRLRDKVALRFHIQGKQRGWTNYIIASTKQDTTARLNTLLSMLSTTVYFTTEPRYLAISELDALAQNDPTDPLIIDQKIALYFEQNELQKADALIDVQLANENSKLRRGLLLLLKTKINLWNNKEHIAAKSIQSAISLFQELNLIHLESKALVELAWVHLSNEQLRLSMDALNQAASKARVSKEPLLEVTAHLDQSFLAAKTGQTELSHTLLGLGNELMMLHQLPDEHQVEVLVNLSWMASSIDDKVRHYQTILDKPFSPQYETYFYVAANIVANYHIQNNQWAQALATLKPWQRRSFQSLIKSRIAFAKNDIAQGFNEAQYAFKYAQTHFHKIDALDAALLLLQQKTALTATQQKDYQTFIQQYATNRWRNQNNHVLQTTNLGDQ